VGDEAAPFDGRVDTEIIKGPEDMLMRCKPFVGGICWAATTLGSTVHAETTVLEDFRGHPVERWEYFADRVMGGVSDGSAAFFDDGKAAYIRLTGTVSTANNGGFIQVRRVLPRALPEGTKGLALNVRGNGESYYVFLRTKQTTRPWHYYNAIFETGADWSTARIPLAAFKPSHDFLAATIDPQSVISIGLVAYGRDHMSDLSVATVALY